MDPFTIMLVVGMAASLASAGMGFYASREQGRQAEYNAEHDAKLQERAAEEERSRRSQEERGERDESQRRLSAMEARYAKAGLLMTGTPTTMVADQAQTDEFNILSRNRFSSIGVSNARQAAELVRLGGANDAKAYRTQGTGQLIAGVGSVATAAGSYGLRHGGRAEAQRTNGAI